MENKLTVRELIFGGHGLVGRLFASNPWVVAVSASIISLLCLNLLAWLLGLDHVSDVHNKDVGYFVKYHWSLFYPVLAPILLCLGILAFRQMQISVYQLIEKSEVRIPVIVDENGKAAYDYPDYLSKQLSAGARWTEIIAGITACIVTAVDTKDLWPGFWNGGHFADSRVPEWDTAFRIPGCHVSLGANCAFDIVAYIFQTLLIFFGLFFLVKYWTFLRIMVQIIDRNRPPYRFIPWVGDLYHRLGLKPLGWVFNLFLIVVVLFQVYGFYHRIELVDLYRQNSQLTYLKTIWTEVESHKPEGKLAEAWAILKLPVQDYAWAGLANPSSWLPLLFSIPPILAICLIPLGRLFWYLRKEISSLTDYTNVKLAEALTAVDKERAADMEKELKCLQETTIWPNGSAAGSIFLVLMIALVIGTIGPPLVLWGLASGILAKLIWSALGKSGKD